MVSLPLRSVPSITIKCPLAVGMGPSQTPVEYLVARRELLNFLNFNPVLFKEFRVACRFRPLIDGQALRGLRDFLDTHFGLQHIETTELYAVGRRAIERYGTRQSFYCSFS